MSVLSKATLMCDCKNFSLANKRTGEARRNKSLILMKAAVDELKALRIKPTIMQVTKILKDQLGETTIKKYWRIVNPKSATDATASLVIANEGKHTVEQLTQSNELLINDDTNKSVSDPNENFVELYVKEWNLKILRPKYFELICKGNKNLAITLYQRQFSPVPFYNL